MREIPRLLFQIEPVTVPVLGEAADAPLWRLDALREGLKDGAVQAVYLALDDLDPGILDLLPLLSATERARAARASEHSLAIKFVLGRWLLRSVLGAVLSLPPEAVPLGVGLHDKPILERDLPDRLSFNLAHSGDWAVLALAVGATVGVDLERVRPLADADRLARRILTRREYQHYRGLAESEREKALLTA